MSGQLVGEVIAASESLRASGLSERGFQAVIAIAEKANTNTRQASVRWDHIRATQYGRSLATAKRAIKELIDAGYVRKIKRGFDNQQGRSAAPVYELSTMPVRPDITRTSGRTDGVSNGSSMVTHSGVGERVTQDDPFDTPAVDLLGPNGSKPDTERVKIETEWVKSETEWVTQDDLLDGLTLDGLTPDGAAARTPDEMNRVSRNGGTSPEASRASGPAFDKLSAQLYAEADMDRQCPNCRADAHEWCQREDGTQKRVPCLARSRRSA